MKYDPKAKIFTVEVDGRAIVSFEALNAREANELVREEWFRRDLQTLTSEGKPLWDGSAAIRSRISSESEAERYARFAEEAVDEAGDILLAFLVDLNTPPHSPSD